MVYSPAILCELQSVHQPTKAQMKHNS